MQLDKMVRTVYPNLTPYTCQLADLPVEEIRQVLGLDKVYKLSFNENPLGPSRKALEAMQEALLQLNLYPSSNGESLLKRLAEVEGVLPENIMLANGADEMILLVAQTFLEPADEVIIPQVTFVQYLAATHLMGAKPVFAPMKEDLRIDLEAVLDRITPRTKLVFLCNPNNPTGTVIPARELEAFLDRVPEHVLVVVDEAYHEYAEGDGYLSSVEYVKRHKNVFVIRTFSKIYSMAGARIGYGIGQAEVVDAVNHVRPPFNVNGVAQAGALASLDDEEHRAESRRINAVGKQLMYATFEELGMKYLPSQANFVCVDTGRDSSALFDRLAERGVIVRNLSGYGLTTSLRVSIGRPEEVEAFVRALKEIILA
ncbi:histidinol-phosphate transaminase [Brevibacillus sp. SYP-B805]|uniref:histidinol-phosphate transaminase n=1 Tax=Brevibacillus sp. SYP-B805 TaxID=1578199 RepID=UPI0013EA9642|nr:histidinol-phosphate transaminase [Brevibacillus sp. SYP-B805]NGQ96144.1 histidinol-phosphate transaminase [Brevibacillus sp. SYP-B805]